MDNQQQKVFKNIIENKTHLGIFPLMILEIIDSTLRYKLHNLLEINLSSEFDSGLCHEISSMINE
jgi:hypothetical protein